MKFREPIKHAIIPAAGHGLRLRPLTLIAPKEMLPLGDKPAAEHIIDELRAIGITSITFIISPNKSSIMDYFGSVSSDGRIQFHYVYQYEQLGLADSILQAEQIVGDQPFITALGDTIILSNQNTNPLERMIQIYNEENAAMVINVEKVPLSETNRYGIVHPNGNYSGFGFEIDYAIEKPQISECPGNYAIGGRYIFQPEIFDLIRETKPGRGNEQQITDSIMLGIERNRSTWCVPMMENECRYDIGNINVYCEAFIAVCHRDEKLSQTVFRSFYIDGNIESMSIDNQINRCF